MDVTSAQVLPGVSRTHAEGVVWEDPAGNMEFGGFGGPGPTDLFISTSTEGPSAQELRNEPSAGAIFHAVPGHRDRSVIAFVGAETTGP